MKHRLGIYLHRLADRLAPLGQGVDEWKPLGGDEAAGTYGLRSGTPSLGVEPPGPVGEPREEFWGTYL